MAKAALFYVRLEKKKQIYKHGQYTDQAANTFHGENISCNARYNAFSNELQIVIPVESAAGYLVPAQVWRVIFNKSEHRKFVLVLLQYLCTAACKAINVKGNTW